MTTELVADLLASALAVNGIATGAACDHAIKQLPARHPIGPAAYTRYVRAADLANGLFWYPPLGIGVALITLAAVVAGLTNDPAAPSR